MLQHSFTHLINMYCDFPEQPQKTHRHRLKTCREKKNPILKSTQWIQKKAGKEHQGSENRRRKIEKSDKMIDLSPIFINNYITLNGSKYSNCKASILRMDKQLIGIYNWCTLNMKMWIDWKSKEENNIPNTTHKKAGMPLLNRQRRFQNRKYYQI